MIEYFNMEKMIKNVGGLFRQAQSLIKFCSIFAK